MYEYCLYFKLCWQVTVITRWNVCTSVSIRTRCMPDMKPDADTTHQAVSTAVLRAPPLQLQLCVVDVIGRSQWIDPSSKKFPVTHALSTSFFWEMRGLLYHSRVFGFRLLTKWSLHFRTACGMHHWSRAPFLPMESYSLSRSSAWLGL